MSQQVITAEDDAFIKSDKNVFQDLLLKPWTPERIVAAQGMGLLYPNIGNEGIDHFDRTGLYPGVLKDIMIVLWLCTILEEPDEKKPSQGMTVIDAIGAPKMALKEAMKWAVDKKIVQMKSDEFWSAYGLFSNIFKQVSDSETQPVKQAGASNETDASDPNE